MTDQPDPRRVETLGPAERILQTLLTFPDHLVHNRPGIVIPDGSTPHGVRWAPVTHVVEGGDKVVYRLDRVKKKTVRVRLGTLDGDGSTVRHGGATVGRYQPAGMFGEVAAWLYRQIADVFAMDNAFAAHWGSWALAQDHRDLKVALAAFLLVQPRAGEPVRDGDEVLFHDDDYRAVGEAMCLIRRRDGKDLNPKLLLRVGHLLALDEVAAINRELGFGRSARNPALGRYPKTVEKWLRHREHNVPMLQGLVRAGYKSTVVRLCQRVGYKPDTPRFFEILRWKQKQSADGRRAIAIGAELAPAASWEGLSEREICERILAESPNYKRIVGLVPSSIGMTQAIVAAAIEAGALSDTDLIVLTPTLEDLGLVEIPEIAERWMVASEAAENQRAARIAERVRSTDVAEKLQDAADRAVQKAVAEVARGLHIYVAVDISASMNQAITRAQGYLTQFLQGFPLDRLTVAVFNTSSREVPIRHASARGVEHAFRGISAGGGTAHRTAILDVFAHRPPAEGDDALFFFVGDQQESNDFADAVDRSGLRPLAFGLLYVPGNMGDRHQAVEATAAALDIPCFRLDERLFDDVYAIPRTLRHLIASTPVDRSRATTRVSLVEQILKTPLLEKPVWA